MIKEVKDNEASAFTKLFYDFVIGEMLTVQAAFDKARERLAHHQSTQYFILLPPLEALVQRCEMRSIARQNTSTMSQDFTKTPMFISSCRSHQGDAVGVRRIDQP